MDAFAHKLGFVMKALSLSRGRLGVELSIDKSVVSRWLSGARAPTANSLVAITALVAGRAPGFSLLDWDLPVDAIAARLGLAPDGRPLPTNAPQADFASFQEWLSLSKLREAASGSAAAGAAAAGFWRAVAPMPGTPGQFGQSFSMFSVHPDGSIRIETGFFTNRRIGWSVAMGNQFFGCVTGVQDGYFAFTVFNRVPAPVLRMMDGIFLGCMADNGGVPIAMPVVMERVGALSGDEDADAERLGELLMRNPVIPAEDVSDTMRQRLQAPSDAGVGVSPVLMMAALTSLASGGRV